MQFFNIKHLKNLITKNQTLLISLIIFAVTFGVYLANMPSDYQKDLRTRGFRNLMPAADTIPNTFLPFTILEYGEIHFNNMLSTIRTFDGNKKPYYLIIIDETYYSVYPILTGLMAVPFYVVPVMLNKIPTFVFYENVLKVLMLGRIAASFYAAGSVVILYLMLRRLVDVSKNRFMHWLMIIFTAFYAFGTNTYSVSSRGLWQHTTSQFIISLALLFLILAVKNKKYIWLVGLFLGLAVLTRPTNIILAVVFALYVFIYHRDQFVKFTLATLPSIVFMLLYNHFIFGSAFTEGYGARNDFDWSTPLSLSLSAYAISPARSFLFISPPLVFGFYAMYKVFLNKKFEPTNNTLFRFIAIAFIGSMLLLAKWYTWHGSPAFGNRMMVDFIPLLAILAFVVIKDFKRCGLIFVGVLMIYSVFIHTDAVLNKKSRCQQQHLWNSECIKPSFTKDTN
jgi:hypothetical protein